MDEAWFETLMISSDLILYSIVLLCAAGYAWRGEWLPGVHSPSRLILDAIALALLLLLTCCDLMISGLLQPAASVLVCSDMVESVKVNLSTLPGIC